MSIDRDFFIKKIAQASIDLYSEYKILPSLTIAQACKESRYGTCSLSPHFNFFGMKWTKTCGCEYVAFKTKEQKENGEYVTIVAKFRKYKSFEEGVRGYYNFITGYKRYHNLIGETDSYTACKKIHADGWATSKTYGESLYNDYVVPLGLEKYDRIVLGTSSIEDYVYISKKCEEYVVKKNDTLWKIAVKYYGVGIKWRKIYDYNNLKSTVIKIGQSLKIPKGV